MEYKNSFKNTERSGIPNQRQEELASMKKRINEAMVDEEILKKVTGDFEYTFSQLGLDQESSRDIVQEIFKRLREDRSLDIIEQEVLKSFEILKVGGKNVIEILHQRLSDRAGIIFSQIRPYLNGISGKVLDFGAGDGQVAQKVHDELGVDISGYDVRSYVVPNVNIPIKEFNGEHIDVPDEYFEVAVVTNVLHHEKNNQKVIDELSRVVRGRLVIIETVPVGETEESIKKDRERTFMNDYLYNRLFHNADVPVPGTYETSEGWIKRFEMSGWKLKHSESLGFDQPTIKDVHHLLVFERK
jgi:ubiquinone/menaquinone biosynthesis C-methylase UbiE